MRAICCILIATALLGGVWSVAAAQSEGPTMAVAAGLDGWCGADSWCPIRVSLANEGAGIEGTLRVSAADTYNTSVHSQPVVLPTHSRKTYFLYFPPIAGGARPVLDLSLIHI